MHTFYSSLPLGIYDLKKPENKWLVFKWKVYTRQIYAYFLESNLQIPSDLLFVLNYIRIQIYIFIHIHTMYAWNITYTHECKNHFKKKKSHISVPGPIFQPSWKSPVDQLPPPFLVWSLGGSHPLCDSICTFKRKLTFWRVVLRLCHKSPVMTNLYTSWSFWKGPVFNTLMSIEMQHYTKINYYLKINEGVQ